MVQNEGQDLADMEESRNLLVIQPGGKAEWDLCLGLGKKKYPLLSISMAAILCGQLALQSYKIACLTFTTQSPQ